MARKKKPAKRAPVQRKSAAKPKKRRVVSRPKKLKAALPWRMAKSLETLREQINAAAPGRSKVSDGGVGDAAHASRNSDHNPWVRDSRGQPVVRARDFTHDPKGGFDSYVFARSLAKTRDPRVTYIISNGQIWNHKEGWRKYTGKNPHDHHAHVSVSTVQSQYDSVKPWTFDHKPADMTGDRPALPVPTDPVLRRGSKGDHVKELQTLLKIKVDGDFGPATERAVKAFQTQRGLVDDGIVQPATWRALRATPTPSAPPADSFARVVEFVVEDEGSDLNVHPHEPGGASRFGVSVTALSKHLGRQATVQDLRELTPGKAGEIYREDYWNKIGADKLPIGFNYAAFDFAVNSGPAVVDGVEGNSPSSVVDFVVEALKEKTVEQQIDKLCDLRLEYMKRDPVKWARYQRGWSARVARVRARAHNMAGE